MMMGPEPRIRIFEMSVRLGIYDFHLLIFKPCHPDQAFDWRSQSNGAWRDLLCFVKPYCLHHCRATKESRSLDSVDPFASERVNSARDDNAGKLLSMSSRRG